jgi:hypothetical protein
VEVGVDVSGACVKHNEVVVGFTEADKEVDVDGTNRPVFLDLVFINIE